MMSYYESCMLCPRGCGADRTKSVGYCGQTDKLFTARASLHMWEEPCISGENGSGTVFFSGCSLKCVYCQNREIALGNAGFEITPRRLAEIFLELQEKGANNINLVTPTHYVPHIIRALDAVRGKSLTIPVLYNCGGYESVETLRLLDGYIDIYMPDFKYMDSAIAQKYSRAADYPDIAKTALAEMTRQTGACTFDARGIMTCGTLVRHLVLPSHIENSKRVLEYLYTTYGGDIYISIMSQYTPTANTRNYPEINRTVTAAEYDEVVDFAVDLGITNAFTQDGAAAEESFIPEFDGEGVVK